MNLRHAGITDAKIKTGTGFSNLGRLRLEENGITDAAAEDIARLKALIYQNLTKSRVYIWETAVTPAAVDKVKALCKDVTIYAGLTAKDVPVEAKIMAPANDRAGRGGARVRPLFSSY